MNISGKHINSLLKTYTERVDKSGKSTGGNDGTTGDGKTDEVRLSQFSKDLQIIQEGLNKISDIREEKVRELKKQIESGSYDIAGNTIAENMIQKIQEENV